MALLRLSAYESIQVLCQVAGKEGASDISLLLFALGSCTIQAHNSASQMLQLAQHLHLQALSAHAAAVSVAGQHRHVDVSDSYCGTEELLLEVECRIYVQSLIFRIKSRRVATVSMML